MIIILYNNKYTSLSLPITILEMIWFVSVVYYILDSKLISIYITYKYIYNIKYIRPNWWFDHFNLLLLLLLFFIVFPGTMLSRMSVQLKPGQLISIQRSPTASVPHCYLNAPHHVRTFVSIHFEIHAHNTLAVLVATMSFTTKVNVYTLLRYVEHSPFLLFSSLLDRHPSIHGSP